MLGNFTRYISSLLPEREREDRIVNYDAPPFWLISAYRADVRFDENAAAHARLRRQLEHDGVDFGETIGRWNGRDERGFIVLDYDGAEGVSDTLRRSPLAEKLLRCALDYRQEALLFVNEDRQAFLVPVERYDGEPLVGDVVELGKFREISPKQAEQSDGFTFFRGRYWQAGE